MDSKTKLIAVIAAVAIAASAAVAMSYDHPNLITAYTHKHALLQRMVADPA